MMCFVALFLDIVSFYFWINHEVIMEEFYMNVFAYAMLAFFVIDFSVLKYPKHFDMMKQ